MSNDNHINVKNDIKNDENLSVAERHYLNHLKAVKKYYNNNKNKLINNNISNYLNIKNNNDILYNEILEQKKHIMKLIKNISFLSKKNIISKILSLLKKKKNYIILMLLNPKKNSKN